jgi:DNA-binding MarR family transcriptional regulator
MARLSKRQHAVKLRTEGSARTPAGDALTELIIPTIRLRALFTSIGEQIAKPAGQTLARWLVLEAVADRPATVAQIARGMGLARQSVLRVADLLERDGLTAYATNPDHRRANLVELTPHGRQALRTIQVAQRAWADAVGAEVGEADLRRTGVVLDRLIRALVSSRQHAGASQT